MFSDSNNEKNRRESFNQDNPHFLEMNLNFCSGMIDLDFNKPHKLTN